MIIRSITLAIFMALCLPWVSLSHANDYYNHANPFTAGSTVRSSDMNTKFDNIEDGFDKLPAPHSGAPTTKGFSEVFEIEDGTARNHPATVGQLQDNDFAYGAWAGSDGNAYTLNLTPDIAAYATGQIFCGSPAVDNDGAVTLDVDGEGPLAVKRLDGTALAAGDLDADGVYCVAHDGTDFALMGQPKIYDQNLNTTDNVTFNQVTTDTIVDPGSGGVTVDGVTLGGACTGCIAVTEGGTGATTAAGALANIFTGTPVATAYLSTAESISDSAWEEINNWTEIADTASAWDEAGNNYSGTGNDADLFVPQVAGTYMYTVQVEYNAPASDGTCMAAVYKNGTIFQQAQTECPSVATTVILTGVVALNGSSDYLSFYAYQDSGGAVNLEEGTSPYDTLIGVAWVSP